MDELAGRRRATEAHLRHMRHVSRRRQSDQPLWREALGARLRRLRKLRRLTLSDLADLAGVSPQYISEVERGRKEPSSEMIAAITGALGLTLIDLTAQVVDELQRGSLDLATSPLLPAQDTGPVSLMSVPPPVPLAA